MKKYLLITLCFFSLTLTSFAQAGYGTELTGNLIIPLGKYADDYNPGFGALVGFYYDVADNFRLAFVTGYLRASINESEINGDFTSGGEQGTIDVSGGVSVIPALLSLRLISPGPGMRLYGMIELGLYTYRTGITGTYTLEVASLGFVPPVQRCLEYGQHATSRLGLYLEDVAAQNHNPTTILTGIAN